MHQPIVFDERLRPIPPVRNGTLPILVIDDDSDTCEALKQLLECEGYRIATETSALRAVQRIILEEFDLVISDVIMPEMSGLDLCQRIAEARPNMPVIFVTGRKNMNIAVQALRRGACDFLTKPLDPAALLESVARALSRRAPSIGNSQFGRQVPSYDIKLTELLGRSGPMMHIHETLAVLSRSLASVLIEGETGTGKEVIARTIHATSPCSAGPFIGINCAAIPSGLLESELFGHVRGAFTGAESAKNGLFLQANGGTLLLDEISELPLAMQPKLLRAIQERKLRPVGDCQEIPFDCRIIAATHRNLETEVKQGRFREDLYYRLNIVHIAVPPLRARRDDIMPLAQNFLAQLSKNSQRELTISLAVTEKIMAYNWPGNVRELENCMECAAALASENELCVADLPDNIRFFKGEGADAQLTKAEDPNLISLFELERRHILRAIQVLGGNRKRIAELLGVDKRTLYRRLARYDLDGAMSRSRAASASARKRPSQDLL